MKFKSFWSRLYSDYLMPSRLGEYEDLILAIKDSGYRQTSVQKASSSIQSTGKLNSVFVHRHDIDTDVATAKKMFDIERKHGVESTFYFRLSTLDVCFMREIEEYGSEASYHYEELASHAKKNHIKSRDVLLRRVGLIQEEFFENLEEIRAVTGLPCATVASHGDFANRKIGLVNHLILKDSDFRNKCNIELESYDDELMKHFQFRISDRPYPNFWHPVPPTQAINHKANNIFLLTHPRQWRSSVVANTRENAVRLYEGLRW
jgi:hypothetical protein